MADLPGSMMPNAVGREQLSQSVVHEYQRDRVLAAVTGVFAKRSYPAATVDHLIAAAKISFGTFYALFEGKEDCFLSAYERAVASAIERIEANQPVEGSQPEKVLAALRDLVELIAEDPMSARLVLVEVQSAGPAPVARHEELLKALVPKLELLRGLSPVSAELPRTFEVATVGGVDWFLKQRIGQGDVDDPGALLRQLAEIVLEPYLGRSETEALLVKAEDSPRPPEIEAQR